MTRKLLVLVAVLVAAGACGNNADETGAAIDSSPQTTQGGVQKCQSRTIPAPAKETDTTKKPTVVVPDGAPPCTLVIQDIKVGTGAAAAAGATVSVQYVGVSWSTRQQFDSSWDRGSAPAEFSLGQVIPGWQQGIPGMKVGGRRRLIIPPAMAYADQGGPGIPPGETLVFVVDLVKAG